MTELRFAKRFAVLVATGALVTGCSTSSPTKVDYKSDSRVKTTSLAVPPDLMNEASDQRSLPPETGAASLTGLQQAQKAAPTPDAVALTPAGMHIQRDGTESWLVVDGKTPEQVWPAVRRFWQSQGFLLVLDSRSKGVMETDWNETRLAVNDDIVRSMLTKATGNGYTAAERNKFRTRLDAAPNGGTYVFISQKGMREVLNGTDKETSNWAPKPNDPVLETEYLKRLMVALGQDTPGIVPNVPDTQTAASSAAGAAAAAAAVRNAAVAGPNEDAGAVPAMPDAALTLRAPYDRSWAAVGAALQRASFTVESSDRMLGLYAIRYVDPKDRSAEEQGFWSQVFHGTKEKKAKLYAINVKALTQDSTRVAVVDDAGKVDDSPQARQIMGLLVNAMN